jgi:hypothetical protein
MRDPTVWKQRSSKAQGFASRHFLFWVWTFEPLQACNALQVGPPTTKLPSSFHVIKRPCRKRQFLVLCWFHSKRVTKCNFKAWQIILWVDFNKLPPGFLTKAVNLGWQHCFSLVAKNIYILSKIPFFFKSKNNQIFFPNESLCCLHIAQASSQEIKLFK